MTVPFEIPYLDSHRRCLLSPEKDTKELMNINKKQEGEGEQKVSKQILEEEDMLTRISFKKPREKTKLKLNRNSQMLHKP